MNKLLWLVLATALLTGCATPQPVYQTLPPVKVITETVELQIYQPPLPPEIKLDEVKWFVVTENNLSEKMAEIKAHTGSDFVVFGLTPQSYENMAYNLQEIRRYMRQQTEIILYYREATKPKGSSGWLSDNAEAQAQQLDRASADNDAPLAPEPTTPQSGFFQRLIPKF
jgi:hypothetical protein